MRSAILLMIMLCCASCAVTAPIGPVDPTDPAKPVAPNPAVFNAVEFSAELAHQAEIANADPAFKASELLDGILNQSVVIGVPEDYCKRVRAACPAIGRKPAGDISADEVQSIRSVR